MVKVKGIILIIFNCFLLVTGQIFWKIGLRQVALSSIKDCIKAVFNIYVFIGLCIYVVATFIWFYILKNNDLTKVYPLQSISYVIVLAYGYLVLNEKITYSTIAGTIIICIGVIVLFKA